MKNLTKQFQDVDKKYLDIAIHHIFIANQERKSNNLPYFWLSD